MQQIMEEPTSNGVQPIAQHLGWVPVPRVIMEKGWYKDSEYVHLFLHLILRANHKHAEFMFNGAIHKLKRGQFLTGRKQLSAETGINESKIERALKLFESEHLIKQQTSNKNRVITILSGDCYVSFEQQNEQQMNSKRTANEQPVNTNNNEKNKKNNSKSKVFI